MRYWARFIQTQWIGSVQLEKFRKNWSTFQVDHFSQSDQSEVWIAPIEISIHLAVARVGEFVRDKASLGEIRKFAHNLKSQMLFTIFKYLFSFQRYSSFQNMQIS